MGITNQQSPKRPFVRDPRRTRAQIPRLPTYRAEQDLNAAEGCSDCDLGENACGSWAQFSLAPRSDFRSVSPRPLRQQRETPWPAQDLPAVSEPAAEDPTRGPDRPR